MIFFTWYYNFNNQTIMGLYSYWLFVFAASIDILPDLNCIVFGYKINLWFGL